MDTPFLAARTDLPDESEKEKRLQLVGFRIGKELFGVDILMVQEIIREAVITPIPDSPAFIEGVINLRGNIIPVVDLRKRLKLHKKDSEQQELWILILNVGTRVTGFIVDRVTEVFKIPLSSLRPPPDIIVAGLKSQYIQGVSHLAGGLLILLDFNRILLVDEFKRLKDLEVGRTAAANA